MLPERSGRTPGGAQRGGLLRRGVPFLATVAVLAACEDGAGPDLGDPVAVLLETVASGLSSPVYLTAPPGETQRIFVVEQGGRIRIIRAGAVEPTPFLDVAGLVSSGSEQGLLGLAFHPEYASNGYFYVNYTDGGSDTQVVRYSVSADPDFADAGSASTVLTVTQPFGNHNGGMVEFGPDGMLYVGLGDGGSGGDPEDHGQRPSTLLGSILRIDVDAGTPYQVPADNPFVSHASAREETWVFGLRNPWRFSFDRATGDLYIGDVGQSALEEVSFQEAGSPGGENYGWRIMEGSACFNPSSGCSTGGLTPPILEYDHGEGCSITGGYVYRGADHPSLTGRYFFADFCSTWIRSFVVENGAALDLQDHSDAFGPVPAVSSFGEDGRGELYVVSLNGDVYRIAAP